MFKGFEKLKDVQYVFTPFDSSLCGVKLEANNKKQYLLTGTVHRSQGSTQKIYYSTMASAYYAI